MAASKPDRGEPVAGDPEGAAPAVGDGRPGQRREQLDQGPSEGLVHAGVAVELGTDGRPEVVGRPRPPKAIRPSAVRCP